MFQEAAEAQPKVELMGDRLRKKRNRTKRRTATPGYRKDPETPTPTPEGNLENQRMKIKYVGSTRSLVRMIGSYAPITPENRAYFEMFDSDRSNALMSKASSFISSNLDNVRQHVDQVKFR